MKIKDSITIQQTIDKGIYRELLRIAKAKGITVQELIRYKLALLIQLEEINLHD